MRKTIALLALLIATSAQALDFIELKRMQASACYSAAAIPDLGLFAQWKLDGDGTSYPVGNNLSLIGGYSWTNGVYSQALYLNGSSGYATNAPAATLLNSQMDRTICYWVRQDNLTGLRTHAALRAGNFDGFFVFSNGTNVFWDAPSSGSAQNRITILAGTSTNWIHFALIQRASGSPVREVYINGEPSSSAETGGIISGSSRLFIGKDSSANQYYLSGAIDDFRIYSRALSSAEITVVLSGGNP